jgi:uncharacterized protein
MPFRNPTVEEISGLLRRSHRIAVVGLSSNPERPSYRVAEYLIERGYEIIPVNPTEGEILGKKAYKSLSEIAGDIDIVDVFRRSDQTDAIIDEAISVGAKALWLQEGVINDEGAVRAQSAGMTVIQDRCVAKELRKSAP